MCDLKSTFLSQYYYLTEHFCTFTQYLLHKCSTSVQYINTVKFNITSCLYTLFIYKQPSYKQPVLRFSANYNRIQYTIVINNNRKQKKNKATFSTGLSVLSSYKKSLTLLYLIPFNFRAPLYFAPSIFRSPNFRATEKNAYSRTLYFSRICRLDTGKRCICFTFVLIWPSKYFYDLT